MIVSCNNVALSNFLYLIFTPPPQKKSTKKKSGEDYIIAANDCDFSNSISNWYTCNWDFLIRSSIFKTFITIVIFHEIATVG